MFESCVEIRKHFSAYLDGETNRDTNRSVRFHLKYCASCSREFERQQLILSDLRSMPARRVPEELGLRLRVAMSQHLHRNVFGRLLVALENALEPLLLPASAGVLATILCFGLVIGSLVLPAAHLREEPVEAATPPRVQDLAPLDFSTGDQPLVLVTHIDAGGLVRDYTVLSGRQSPAVLHRLDRMMYYSHFVPATLDGKPTDGQMVLYLHRITVRG